MILQRCLLLFYSPSGLKLERGLEVEENLEFSIPALTRQSDYKLLFIGGFVVSWWYKCKELAISLLNYNELFNFLLRGNNYITRLVHCAIKIGQDANHEWHWSFVFAPKVLEEELKCFQIVPQYCLHNFTLKVLRKLLEQWFFLEIPASRAWYSSGKVLFTLINHVLVKGFMRMHSADVIQVIFQILAVNLHHFFDGKQLLVRENFAGHWGE